MAKQEKSASYHHGDLRDALVMEATKMLENKETFSLRAVARAAGVSAAAPYRHFRNRQELETAIAVAGFHNLTAELSSLSFAVEKRVDLAEFAVAYVRFALEHPATFKLMFGQECDPSSDARVAASGALSRWLEEQISRLFPERDTKDLAVAFWGLAHGLAFLHLDGKLPSSSFEQVQNRVRSTFAVLVEPSREA